MKEIASFESAAKDTHPFTGLSCTMNGLCVAMSDLVKAHLWYSLGADTGSATIGDARYGVAKRLTRDEIEEARYFLNRWKPSPWSCQVSHMGEVAG